MAAVTSFDSPPSLLFFYFFCFIYFFFFFFFFFLEYHVAREISREVSARPSNTEDKGRIRVSNQIVYSRESDDV